MAMHARPVPQHPYTPLPAIQQSRPLAYGTSDPSSTSTEIHPVPSPFIPIRMPVFTLVLWINDAVVRILTVGSPKRGPGRPSAASSSRGRNKSWEGEMEGVEAGVPLRGGMMSPPLPPVAQAPMASRRTMPARPLVSSETPSPRSSSAARSAASPPPRRRPGGKKLD